MRLPYFIARKYIFSKKSIYTYLVVFVLLKIWACNQPAKFDGLTKTYPSALADSTI